MANTGKVMTEIEFREKFTERFKLEPDEVIPTYVLEQAETIPTEAANLTKEELHWAQKVAAGSRLVSQRSHLNRYLS